MKRVGITGGIGAGKTTVCQIFESFDIPVYYADQRAKEIMEEDEVVIAGIRSIAGKEAYLPNGRLNRQVISDLIFNQRTVLKQINQLVHPAVARDVARWFAAWEEKGIIPYALEEAALLIESGSWKSLDALIVVTCPTPVRIARVMKRDGLSQKEVEARIASQITDEERIKKATFVLVNDGVAPLLDQVFEIHKKLAT